MGIPVVSKNPDELPFHSTVPIVVEPCEGGYWSYYGGRRSPGIFPDTPLNQYLRWILEQVSFGHSSVETDEDGEVVSVLIGRRVPHKVSSSDNAAQLAGEEHVAVGFVGAIAEAREKGSHPKTADFEKECWDKATESTYRRMEIHYGLVFCELLGRVLEKLPKLECLPIIESAPENTRDYLAEATRCYLLKMDRACIALCRACLEDTLKSTLTAKMKQEWFAEIELNKKKSQNSNPMWALIRVCAKHGVLGNYETDAHDIRIAGNGILHMAPKHNKGTDLAGGVLKKTRIIIGLIHGS